jgi:hypothetical protein
MPDPAPRLSDARLADLRELLRLGIDPIPDVHAGVWLNALDDLADARATIASIAASRDNLLRQQAALQTQVDELRDEIARAAPFLAARGLCGYRVKLPELPPEGD